MELNKHDIAERFLALAPQKQKEFLAALKKQGLDFSLLPIVWQKIGKSQHALVRAAAALVFMAAGAIEHGVSSERRVAIGWQAGYGGAGLELPGAGIAA